MSTDVSSAVDVMQKRSAEVVAVNNCTESFPQLSARESY